MLMRTDPFRELDRLALDRLAPRPMGPATSKPFMGPATSKPSAMPLDAYREGDGSVVAFDIPGVTADAIDIGVERTMLTVRAERRPVARADDVQTDGRSERPPGAFSRPTVLADALG